MAYRTFWTNFLTVAIYVDALFLPVYASMDPTPSALVYLSFTQCTALATGVLLVLFFKTLISLTLAVWGRYFYVVAGATPDALTAEMMPLPGSSPLVLDWDSAETGTSPPYRLDGFLFVCRSGSPLMRKENYLWKSYWQNGEYNVSLYPHNYTTQQVSIVDCDPIPVCHDTSSGLCSAEQGDY